MIKCHRGECTMEMNTIFLQNKHFKDFNPLDFGQQQCDPLYSFGYNNIRTYLIHYIISGEGTLYKNGQVYHVHAGEAFLIRKGETAHYIADEKNPWNYIWIRFSGELSDKFKTLNDVFPAPGDIFNKMLRVLNTNTMSEEFLASTLFSLYIELFSAKPTYESHVYKVKNYIELHYAEDIKISNLADLLNINRKYLAKIFKIETGYTMKEYLVRTKMRYAAELILNGHTVSEVSEMLSYSDSSVFSTAFYRHFGYYPTELKKKK